MIQSIIKFNCYYYLTNCSYYIKEKYGKVTLRQHYERIAIEGQEYDPYTTMLAKPK